VAQVHNNQRDGFHRQTINRGRVNYEPNSLAGGCPFQAGAASGFMSFPDRIEGDKVRGRPERFAEHFNQAGLFYESQTAIEKAHILRAFRFELTKVQVPAIRERVVSMLANASTELAQALAADLGIEMPATMPAAIAKPVAGEVEVSPALSLFARPGDGSIRTRRVAILVAEGTDGEAVRMIAERMTREAPSRGSSARALGTFAPRKASSCPSTRPRRRRRRCSTTPSRCRVARRRRAFSRNGDTGPSS
jgi:catalase